MSSRCFLTYPSISEVDSLLHDFCACLTYLTLFLTWALRSETHGAGRLNYKLWPLLAGFILPFIATCVTERWKDAKWDKISELYYIKQQNAHFEINILIFYILMSATCFESVVSSWGRRLYLQLRYGAFYIHQYISISSLVMLYVFFWVTPRRPNFICRRFGTLCLFHLHRQVGK